MKGFVASIDELVGVMNIKEVSGSPSLQLLKEAIGGGLIETVPYFDSIITHTGQLKKCVAFVDEEGKLKGQAINVMANKLWHQAQQRRGHAPIQDVLVGKVCIVWGDEAWMREL